MFFSLGRWKANHVQYTRANGKETMQKKKKKCPQTLDTILIYLETILYYIEYTNERPQHRWKPYISTARKQQTHHAHLGYHRIWQYHVLIFSCYKKNTSCNDAKEQDRTRQFRLKNGTFSYCSVRYHSSLPYTGVYCFSLRREPQTIHTVLHAAVRRKNVSSGRAKKKTMSAWYGMPLLPV